MKEPYKSHSNDLSNLLDIQFDWLDKISCLRKTLQKIF